MLARSAVVRILLVILSVIVGASAADAQWSIGAPGSRQAPAGQHRYVFLVFANPVPGMEADFNDWYSTVHIGDIVQLPGWTGAQRFRIVSNLNPRPTAEGYRHGYLIIWDMEAASANVATQPMIASLNGGKIRRGAAFDYSSGAAGSGVYEILGPRITRPDGKGPVVPDRNDSKVPRLNRYIVMDLSTPAAGKEADFETAMNQRIKDALALPGWLAAQRFKVATNTGLGGRAAYPEYLTVWEIQAATAQAAQVAFADALKSGALKPLPIDEKTAQFTYWEPMIPYVTRDDFER